jgi:4,5-dihydroxyphthalate decarboxylase
MPNVHVTIATWDYDHVRDLRMGEIRPVGIDVTWLDLNMHEIFARFLANREWDVSELSLAKYIAEASGPDPDLIALPVFLRDFATASSRFLSAVRCNTTSACLSPRLSGCRPA